MITPELRLEIELSGDEPVRIEDPETKRTYLVVREEVYRKLKELAAGKEYGSTLNTSEEFGPKETYPALDRVFGEGWNDPKMAEYDVYDRETTRENATMKKVEPIVAGAILALAGAGTCVGADEPGSLARVPYPEGLVAPGTLPTVAARTSFLEGPAVDAKGDLYFSDLIGNRILKMNPQGAVSVFRPNSGRTNGNTFDAQGHLISCEGAEQGPGGRRRIVRTDIATGDVTVLTERFEGKRYNAPNDVCVDIHGRIWFTDPYYGEDRNSLELSHESVYRIDTNGQVTRVVTQPAIDRPNGIAITPDAKTLYLIDSHPKPGGNRKIWAFQVSDDGSLSGQRLVYDFGRGRGGDGMRLDVRGNLWVAAGIILPRTSGETVDVPAGVYVITPDGKLLGRIPIPEDVITNIAFGGPDRKTMYVTAGKAIFKVPIEVEGYALYPPKP